MVPNTPLEPHLKFSLGHRDKGTRVIKVLALKAT